MTDDATDLLDHPGKRNRRRSGTGFPAEIPVDGTAIRALTLQILGSPGIFEGQRESAALAPLAGNSPTALAVPVAALSLPAAASQDKILLPYVSVATLPDSAATPLEQTLRSFGGDQAPIRAPAAETSGVPSLESEAAAPSPFGTAGLTIHQAASMVPSAPLLAGTVGGPAGQPATATTTVASTTTTTVDISHITADVSAVVVSGAKAIALSSLFTVTASSSNPTYLVVSILDRDEYTASASGTTGTLSGNGHTTSLSAATGSDDGRTLGIVFTYDATTGHYTNSTYGNFDALTYTASSSAGDVTDIAVYATNNATVASHYAANTYALTLLDASGYVSTATIATQASFTGTVPSQATPSSLEAIAQSFVGQAWNMDGCWTLACTIAAEAGSALPVASTYVGTAGQAGGEWTVAYNGPVQASSNWESALTAGEFVVFETSGGTGHITFVVSGSGSSAKLIDNITYETANGTIVNAANDGSTSDVLISAAHAASQEFSGVSASSVVIYELDTPIVSTLVTADTLALGATQSLSSLFSVIDPASKTITEYQIYNTNTGDSLIINGITVSAHTAAAAAEASSLSAVSLAAGATAGTETIELRAYNGTYWGDWDSVTVTVNGSTTTTVSNSGSGTGTTTAATIAVTATPAQTAIDGTAYSLTLAANTFVDSAGLALTTKAYQTSGASAISWLHYNSSTLTLTGTAPAGLSGSITVDIVATDTAGHTASDIFSLTFAHGTATAIALVGTATSSTESLELG